MKRLQAEIRQFMEKRSLKQEAFAELVGVSQGTVSRWLKAVNPTKPDPDQMKRLSNILKVDGLALLDEASPPPQQAPASAANIAAEADPVNASRRLAANVVSGLLLDRICATKEGRERLANPNYRRQVARLLVAAATAPLDHDAILADSQVAQQQAQLLFYALAHQEFEQ